MKATLVFVAGWLLASSLLLAQDSAMASKFEQPAPPRVTIKLPNNKAADVPKGPFQPSWESIKANYKVPDWFVDGKFGVFIHYGVYTVAAHASEWYPRHMYSNDGVRKWHEEHFGGPVDKVGYKDLIPLFRMEKFNADDWAELLKRQERNMWFPPPNTTTALPCMTASLRSGMRRTWVRTLTSLANWKRLYGSKA